MIEAIRNSWRRLPGPIRKLLRRTGVPYAASYLATYREKHHRDRFAGTLVWLKETRFEDGRVDKSTVPAASLDAILDSIVLPNGVRKTTMAARQLNTLKQFLSRSERPPDGSCIRVLDLPCSSGVASNDSYDLLRCHYNITLYVLADLCLEVTYDRERNCIYDPAGRLLQVQGKRFFFSVYRAHTSGAEYTFLSDLLLLPVSLRARQLRHKYPVERCQTREIIRLLHPETERRVDLGMFSVRNADVFSVPWVEEFELVLSFNLLQKNYFSSSKIGEGLQNLGRALTEGGYLVTGNTESFAIMRKTKGVLATQYQQGEW